MGSISNILMMPDFRDANPYQELLCEGLKRLGLRVDFPSGYRRVFPVLRATQDHRPDILHLHWLGPYLKGSTKAGRFVYASKLVADLRLVRATGIPIVWTVHNTLSHDTDFPGLETWIRKAIARTVARIIVHDPFAREAIIRQTNVNKEDVSVIPHGHYRSAYPPPPAPAQARKELDIPLDASVVLHFGLLRPYKGLTDLLKIWPRIVQEKPNSYLLIAGKAFDPSYERKIRRIASNLPRVHLDIGFVDNVRVPSYFAAADIMALPFRRITTSGTVLLAISFEVPVVAPRFPGIQWTLHPADRYLYQREKGREGLRQSILRALQSDQKNDKAVLREVCQRLDWEEIARHTSDAYHAAYSLHA